MMQELTRIEIWRDPQIGTDEWSAVALSAGLKLVDHQVGVNPRTGETVRIATPHGACWSGSNDDSTYFFRFAAGRISIEWGDKDCRRKAGELASLLGAQLRVSEVD